jgi:hypothetical protein
MHKSLWALVAHSSFTEGSHMTKNTASGVIVIKHFWHKFTHSFSQARFFHNKKTNIVYIT